MLPKGEIRDYALYPTGGHVIQICSLCGSNMHRTAECDDVQRPSRDATSPSVTEAMVDAAIAFDPDPRYLAHDKVRPYLGTANGDSPAAWRRDYIREFVRTVLAADTARSEIAAPQAVALDYDMLIDRIGDSPLAIEALQRLRDGASRSATAASRWIQTKERQPDLDGRLWAILTKRMHNGANTGYIPLYEYYHFNNGWATDDEVTHWLDCPLHPFPEAKR